MLNFVVLDAAVGLQLLVQMSDGLHCLSSSQRSVMAQLVDFRLRFVKSLNRLMVQGVDVVTERLLYHIPSLLQRDAQVLRVLIESAVHLLLYCMPVSV